MLSLKEKLIDQRRERLNRDNEELAERTKASPTYFPFSKNKNKHIIARFEATSPEEIIKRSEEMAAANGTSPEQRQPSAIELSNQLDKHEQVTYRLLERDLKGRDVLRDAAVRVDEELEKKRMDKLTQRKEAQKAHESTKGKVTNKKAPRERYSKLPVSTIKHEKHRDKATSGYVRGEWTGHHDFARDPRFQNSSGNLN